MQQQQQQWDGREQQEWESINMWKDQNALISGKTALLEWVGREKKWEAKTKHHDLYTGRFQQDSPIKAEWPIVIK